MDAPGSRRSRRAAKRRERRERSGARRRRPPAIATAGAILVLLAALVTVVLFGEGWVERAVERSVEDFRDRLDRPVQIAEIEVSRFGSQIDLRGVRVGAAAGEPPAPPALALDEARVRVGLLQTLLTAGERPHIRSITLEGLNVHVLARPDGTLNWEHIAARLTDSEDPPDPAAQRRFRATRLDHLRLDGGRVVVPAQGQQLVFDLEARGELGQPTTWRVDVPAFEATAGRSDLRGELTLEDLEAPQLTFEGTSRFLDPNDFRLPARRPAGEAEPPPPALARAGGRIALEVEAGSVAGAAYEDLEARLRLREGRATAEELAFTVFGGRFTGAGSELPLPGAPGPYRIRGAMEGMQVSGLVERLSGAANLLTGNLSATAELEAEDLTLEALSRTLSGRLDGTLTDAELVPASGFAALADRLQALAAVPGLGAAIGGFRERVEAWRSWTLEEVSGQLELDDGAVLAARPITARTPQGELTFEGRLSLTEAGDVRGTLALTPEALSTLVGRDVDLAAPVPVPFRMQGPLTSPSFTFGDLRPVLEPLAQAYLRARGERELKEALERWLPRRPPPEEREEEAPREDDEPTLEQRLRERLEEELRRRR